MLLLNFSRALALLLVASVLYGMTLVSDNVLIILAVYLVVYALVMTGADVLEQWLVRKFDTES